MAGIIFAPDGRDWAVPSSVFYWTVDVLSSRVQIPDLAERLREISQYNLGSLDVGSLPEAQQHDFTTAVHDLPTIAEAKLPASSEREAIIAQINELTALFAYP